MPSTETWFLDKDLERPSPASPALGCSFVEKVGVHIGDNIFNLSFLTEKSLWFLLFINILEVCFIYFRLRLKN